MTNKILLGISSIVLIAGAALPVFAQTGTTPTATTSTTSSAKIACVGAAVNARETVIDSALSTYTTALNTAYSTRASALKDAYNQTTLTAVKVAVKTAWSNFTSSTKSARMAWQSTRSNAWATYRTAATACKAPTGTGDGTHSASDISGN